MVQTRKPCVPFFRLLYAVPELFYGSQMSNKLELINESKLTVQSVMTEQS